jgi:hypothetical protein
LCERREMSEIKCTFLAWMMNCSRVTDGTS